jgi:hypothetical protein
MKMVQRLTAVGVFAVVGFCLSTVAEAKIVCTNEWHVGTLVFVNIDGSTGDVHYTYMPPGTGNNVDHCTDGTLPPGSCETIRCMLSGSLCYDPGPTIGSCQTYLVSRCDNLPAVGESVIRKLSTLNSESCELP